MVMCYFLFYLELSSCLLCFFLYLIQCYHQCLLSFLFCWCWDFAKVVRSPQNCYLHIIIFLLTRIGSGPQDLFQLYDTVEQLHNWYFEYGDALHHRLLISSLQFANQICLQLRVGEPELICLLLFTKSLKQVHEDGLDEVVGVSVGVGFVEWPDDVFVDFVNFSLVFGYVYYDGVHCFRLGEFLLACVLVIGCDFALGEIDVT